ncbi:hypothetical protein BVC80_8831g12 [Macleaya cordata]|uniref:Zinc finger protein n=1 Tax=Macleaya cordata TaxID=56857 RepID=A0A200RE57_MACCD|nr:hypothetical protein BVC80_8831g12 [Macleaya cordata]
MQFNPPKQHRSLGCFGCGETDHWKNKCLLVCTPCRINGCEETRELKTSKRVGYEGDRYLWCNECEDTQWFTKAKKLKETPKSCTTCLPMQ